VTFVAQELRASYALIERNDLSSAWPSTGSIARGQGGGWSWKRKAVQDDGRAYPRRDRPAQPLSTGCGCHRRRAGHRIVTFGRSGAAGASRGPQLLRRQR